MLFVTKAVEFSAAHRLFNPNFDNCKNDEIFDKCNNYFGHGHNYRLEVTIAGLPNHETGYIIDLKLLKRIIDEFIVNKVDHKHLNYDVDFIKGYIPTVENLAILFWRELEKNIPQGELYSVKLFETENSWVEYKGDPIHLTKYAEE